MLPEEKESNHRRLSDIIKTSEFRECPRFHWHEISEEQIEVIAERAAEKALKKGRKLMYEELGKGVVSNISWLTSKFFWLVGIVAVVIYFFMLKHGLISK